MDLAERKNLTFYEYQRDYQKRYREEHREQIRVNHKRWREKNKEKLREQHVAFNAKNPHYMRNYKRANPEKTRENSKRDYIRRRVPILEFYRHRHLEKAYGMSMGDLSQMLAQQDWKCLICAKTIDEYTRAIDHDHQTKTIRGLLCRNCNSAIGLFKDNAEICRAAAKYLSQT